jgi:hypothetical protein
MGHLLSAQASSNSLNELKTNTVDAHSFIDGQK